MQLDANLPPDFKPLKTAPPGINEIRFTIKSPLDIVPFSSRPKPTSKAKPIADPKIPQLFKVLL